MEQKTILLNLLAKLEKIFNADQRIAKYECIGSVKSGDINRHSDLDLTVYIDDQHFKAFYNRNELENLFKPAGLITLAIYYSPTLCIGLFENGAMADIMFKTADQEVEVEKPGNLNEKMADIYRIFWSDCYYFVQLIDDNVFYRWEAIRGLNVIRERHLINLLFHGIETQGAFPSFKKSNHIPFGETFFKELSHTLAASDDPASIKKAFRGTIALFEKLYDLKEGKKLPEMDFAIREVTGRLNS
jgi:predicted nucleotidyltransferase